MGMRNVAFLRWLASREEKEASPACILHTTPPHKAPPVRPPPPPPPPLLGRPQTRDIPNKRLRRLHSHRAPQKRFVRWRTAVPAHRISTRDMPLSSICGLFIPFVYAAHNPDTCTRAHVWLDTCVDSVACALGSQRAHPDRSAWPRTWLLTMFNLALECGKTSVFCCDSKREVVSRAVV